MLNKFMHFNYILNLENSFGQEYDKLQKNVVEGFIRNGVPFEVVRVIANPSFSVDKMNLLYEGYRKEISIDDIKKFSIVSDDKRLGFIIEAVTDGRGDIIVNRMMKKNMSNDSVDLLVFYGEKLEKKFKGKILADVLDDICRNKYFYIRMEILAKLYIAGCSKEFIDFFHSISDDKFMLELYNLYFFDKSFSSDELKKIYDLGLKFEELCFLCQVYKKEYITKESILSMDRNEILIMLDYIKDDMEDLITNDLYNSDVVNLKSFDNLRFAKDRSRRK